MNLTAVKLNGKTLYKSDSKENKGKYYNSKGVRIYPVDCHICGSFFIGGNITSKYCSDECRGVALDRRTKNIVENRNCEWCGELYVWRSIKPGQKYCSNTCSSEAKKNWKRDERAIDREAIRSAVELKVKSIFEQSLKNQEELNGVAINYWNISGFTPSVREKIRERDNYTCQVCGFNEGRVEVHHILKRSLGGGHTPDNLITLCVSCHRAIETNDLKHAIVKCCKNALNFMYGKKETQITESQKITSLVYALETTFEKISEHNLNGELNEVMVTISNVLDEVNI